MSDACGCEDSEARRDQTQEPETESDEREPEKLWQVSELRFAALAGVLLAAGYGTGWAGAPEAVSLILKAAALAAGAWTFVPATLRRLATGKIGVGTLMTLAATGAVLLGEVGEAATLAFLYAIAEGLEEYSLARTRRGLRSLLSLVPAQATVIRDGHQQQIPPERLRIGDLLLVRPGERVATDGTIHAGHSSLDLSAITGESMPVEAGAGDEVFAAAINGTGVLEVEVTATAQDNSLARIVRIVEAERARKGTSQRLADRIARPLVPGIMAAAVLIAALGSLLGDPLTWIERALVVLVAASPCALAISVPVTVTAAIGAASRFGVLVKGGAALEALGRVRTVALDKTGTLTRNQPAVVDIATVDGATADIAAADGATADGGGRDRVLAVAAGLESRSEHPLARAILAAASKPVRPANEPVLPHSEPVRPATDVVAVPGAGLVGRIDGRPVRLGRPGWLDPGELADRVAAMQANGATVVLVEADGRLLGAIAVRDELRPEAGEVVAGLRRRGYQVAMLTGDNLTTATAVAAQAGIAQVHAGLRPEDKAGIVTRLRRQHATAMVGDGINDAPALAAANPGIAMGAMGTDMAIETADVALMGHDLRHLPQVFDHARRSRAIMWQNIGLSLALITALMPLALLGVLGLAAVVLVHEIAEVVVIGNGIRAARARPLPPAERGPHQTTAVPPAVAVTAQPAA